jgi:hypothetical protein
MFRKAKHKEALAAGRAGVRAKMNDEECTEAENDVISLSMSYLFVNAIRFCITGALPDEEGHDGSHPWPLWCTGTLFGLGVVLVLLSGILVMIIKGETEEQEESALGRFLNTLLNSLAMMSAWCILWATRWLARLFPAIYHLPSMTGVIIIAVEVTLLAGCMIFVLDTIDDSLEDSKAGSTCIRTIINALGVLVGFSWEHGFDFGVVSIAQLTPASPEVTKIAFAGIVVLFVVPAWRRHILFKVMVLQRLKDAREEMVRQGNVGIAGEAARTLMMPPAE